ncbi:MAG: replicative DNA helicase [Parachlamydiales bacterium]|nr:replicative DNA helicase [Parachlamydiales bacterium]
MAKTKVLVAPNSKEAEMMVLGCMLTNLNSLNIGADGLHKEDFYYTEHRTIFAQLQEAFRKDKPADVHIIAEELKKNDQLENVGGISYLTTLAQYAGTSAFIEEYVRLIRDKSILRQMIDAAQIIEKEALEQPDDVSVALDDAQAKFFLISQAININPGISIKELLSGAAAESKTPFLIELQERQESFQKTGSKDKKITGIATHFYDLDKLINGFNNSNLMILAARPAMGKTALALNFAENIAFSSNLPVGIFSLEMSAEQLLHRMICSRSGVESDKIITGSLDGNDYQRIVTCVNNMSQHTVIIDDQPGLKITDLRARARRMKETYDIQFLVIDYLQLLSGSGTLRSQDNRQNEISEISRMLKNLARELRIPVLCLSQLSRKVEERNGHRPMMSDLRESGCLASNTLIYAVDRDEYYTIKHLSEHRELLPITILALDATDTLSEHRMTHAFFSGKKMTYTLSTSSGKSIRATSNHPFYTKNGWTPLDQLQAGDLIGVKDEQDLAWHFEEILSIEVQEEEEVYDATVEGVHNFLANDLIVHNSIEQDSDLVMFLLRREYYDPYDKPGQAELIIAKNRHGAIGIVPLTFRKEIAQFANFTDNPS